jgi:3-oxoacyl-[acyl-carrier protein] reductase
MNVIPFRLDGKVALVTGGNRGIGRETALGLAKRGCCLLINYGYEEEKETAEQTVYDIAGLGVKVSSFQADVSKKVEVEEMVGFMVRQFHRIDILVNNAGIHKDALIHQMKEEDWDQVVSINLKGSFNCIQSVSSHMMKQIYGKIVNISSVAYMGNRGTANYSASKAGVIGLTRTAALELAKYNICVNSIAPGMIESPMFRSIPDRLSQKIMARIPLGRLGNPQDVVNGVLFLVSDESNYITGQTLIIDGGLTVGYI